MLNAPALPQAEMSESFSQPPTDQGEGDNADAGWKTLAQGLEWRIFSPEGQPLGQITALRIDPALYTFRVHYRPGEPLAVIPWRDTLSDAVAFVNANFFDEFDKVVGLLISEGAAHGQAFTTRGGTFALGEDDGNPLILSNTESPYQGEAYRLAVQGFPMLVQDGAAVYTSEDRATRRTAIGIDAEGRVVLMTTPGLGLKLRDLSTFLAESELALVDAFNLDGGGSTMMSISLTSESFLLPSRDAVPTVLAVYPR